MTSSYPPNPLPRWIAWTLAIVIFPACDKSVTPDRYELPMVEPATADTANKEALNEYQIAQGRLDKVESTETADWPQLFGPERTSVASANGLHLSWGDEGPQELWSIDIGTGYGSPVVAGDQVVFNHRDGDEEIVQCCSVLDGAPRWVHRYPTTFQCDYEYSNGPYSTPLIHDGRVYTVGGQGQLHCLDLESGEVVWSRDLHADYEMEDDVFPVGASPLIADGRLIFNIGAVDKKAGIIALDPGTGSELWRSTDLGAAYCSPYAATIHGNDFLFVITDRGLVSLDPVDGKMDWIQEHYSRSPLSYNAVSPLVVDDMVLLVTGPGPGAVCVQIQPDRSRKERWRNRRVLDSQFNSLILNGTSVIGFTAAGQGGAELRCVDIASGELRWKYHSVLRRGQGLIAGKALVLLGERGHLAAILAGEREPKVLSFTKEPLMKEPCYCAPAIAGGRLFLKDETRLACFDLSMKD